ncbi:MAG TPA: hypothetical protein VN519_05035 [Bryobacteraceae bacterium]|nr:hypothetical protein [Bryobacteraceae bacterium]
MTILKGASAMFCVAATAMVFAPRVSAQEPGNQNQLTRFTFSGPVEIPGVHLKGFKVLPAGTYVFRLVDSQTDRHIVQIQSEDQSKTYATILAIPNTRLHPTDKSVITFDERPAGQPPALRAWFYPGATWGDEFVYSKKEARDLAQTNNTPVLYSSNDANSNEVTEPIQAPTKDETARMEKDQVGAYNPHGEEEQLSAAVASPTPAANPQTETPPAQTYNQVAQNAPPANSAPAPVTSPDTSKKNELPQTAGNTGLLMLGGLLALGGAFSIRYALLHA